MSEYMCDECGETLMYCPCKKNPLNSESDVERLVMKPCPCGKTPTKITVVDAGQGYKWANASPNCCGEWLIEFRTVGYDLKSEATQAAAIEAWNDAPRAS